LEKTNTTSKKVLSKEYKVKFYSTVFRSRYIPLLKCLRDGMYPSQIAVKLKWSKQHVNYYIQKLKQAGLIFKEKHSNIAIWGLTAKGTKVLTEGESVLHSSFTFRLHNCFFKYPIVKDGLYSAGNLRRVEMQNWTALLGFELGVSVKKTSQSWIVHLDVVRGKCPDDLLLQAKDVADRVAVSLMRKYGVVLGEGVVNPHYELASDDPLASVLSKYVCLSVGNRMVDDSEATGRGEIDHVGRDAAIEYLRMPERVKSAEGQVEYAVGQLRRVEGQLAELKENFGKLLDVLSVLTAGASGGSEVESVKNDEGYVV
jgi:predicted transcriptional regulator